MKKYKKIITGLILGLICAILPFVSVAKVKALTVDEITTTNDLKNTSWILNESVSLLTASTSVALYVQDNVSQTVATYQYNINNYLNLYPTSSGRTIIQVSEAITLYTENDTSKLIHMLGSYRGTYDELPRLLTFNNYNYGQHGDFIGWLKQNAELTAYTPPPPPPPRTIPFKITLITNVFGVQLEYINSSLINLPVLDDTVSFTVSFENNKMINGQIEHPESADELGELTFSNGERVFYTIHYNETNIEFKLYFYGEQLFLYEAVMYNTEVLDSGGNYLATVATYSEGISEQEMETLKNSGIYQASFDITIPQEANLVTDAQLMLEIGIIEGSEPPGFDNITNIMTGIFTLVSSFLSIQLGFITLGQIIGLILAIGVIFFIFYVWNGGRNGN